MKIILFNTTLQFLVYFWAADSRKYEVRYSASSLISGRRFWIYLLINGLINKTLFHWKTFEKKNMFRNLIGLHFLKQIAYNFVNVHLRETVGVSTNEVAVPWILYLENPLRWFLVCSFDTSLLQEKCGKYRSLLRFPYCRNKLISTYQEMNR